MLLAGFAQQPIQHGRLFCLMLSSYAPKIMKTVGISAFAVVLVHVKEYLVFEQLKYAVISVFRGV